MLVMVSTGIEFSTRDGYIAHHTRNKSQVRVRNCSQILGIFNFLIRVSSTLDKSVGKKHLTDGSAETCWTSAQVCNCVDSGLYGGR